MTGEDLLVRKTAVTLADGRALLYFGATPTRPGDYPDRRPMPAVHVRSQARWDRVLGEWVVIASHRQDRTFQPAEGQCPLCPSRDGRSTEIPAPEYDVVVFENRFPTLGGQDPTRPRSAVPDGFPAAARPLLATRPPTPPRAREPIRPPPHPPPS